MRAYRFRVVTALCLHSFRLLRRLALLLSCRLLRRLGRQALALFLCLLALLFSCCRPLLRELLLLLLDSFPLLRQLPGMHLGRWRWSVFNLSPPRTLPNNLPCRVVARVLS